MEGTSVKSLDDLIAHAIEQHEAIEAEKRRKADAERQRFVDAQIARVKHEIEHKLSPAVRDALRIDYGYGQVRGYTREGFECEYATLHVDDAVLWLLFDTSHVNDGHISSGYQRWVLITSEHARLGLKAFDAVTAERNLLLAIHSWRTPGTKALYED